jgi:hypothetical protein
MSYCCYAGDLDPAELTNEQWYSAAKPYRCCECSSKIEPGEQYQRIRQLYECNWYQYITCEKCADLRASLEDVMCVYYEGLEEAFVDWLTHGPNKVMSVKAGSHAARLAPSYFQEENDDD